MKQWYERYYKAIGTSAAYSEFCRSVFGDDYGQHGFADMQQVQLLQDALEIRPGERLLDIGCGTGGVTAHLASSTGASAIGLEYIESACSIGKSRYGTATVHFVTADIGRLCFQPHSFDVIVSIDSLYFHPLPETVAHLSELLTPSGRIGALYSYGADPEHPLATFNRSRLPADKTPMSEALRLHGLHYSGTELTAADYEHALLKKAVLEELRPAFEREGNDFLFENRYGEANGVLTAVQAGAHARYLYVIRKLEY